MKYYNDYRHMIDSMKSTWQIPGKQTVYEHCLSVTGKALELYDYLTKGKALQSDWKLPPWLQEHRELIVKELIPRAALIRYTQYHDCGKPLVAEIRNGKPHFPGHEFYSEAVYRSFLKKDRQVIRLIKNDMLIHRSKCEDVQKLFDFRERMTLLIVSLAELHANAELFGGIESDSFKIKYKKLDSRGKAVFRKLICPELLD
jgi:hypothetical protein